MLNFVFNIRNSEDLSAVLLVGCSFLIIIFVLFEMVKTIIKDCREKKEEATETV
ncbi:MAG: hypothetical protein AAB404_02290 [Patescibacteria group bacterium]|mgnify:CR=1 FL=1